MMPPPEWWKLLVIIHTILLPLTILLILTGEINNLSRDSQRVIAITLLLLSLAINLPLVFGAFTR